MLSVLPSLVSLLVLWNKAGKGAEKKIAEYEKAINNCVRYIFAKIDKGDGSFVFDASPYVSASDGFSKEKAFIDTITWVVPAMQMLRKAIISGRAVKPKHNKTVKPEHDGTAETEHKLKLNSSCTFIKSDETPFDTTESDRAMAEKVLVFCLNYVNDACIKEKVVGKTVYHGWNFTKLSGDAEAKSASLYFSYAVSTIYLTLYNAYSKYIDLFRSIENEIFFKGGKIVAPPANYWKDKMSWINEAKYVDVFNSKKGFEIKATVSQFVAADWENINFLMNQLNGGNLVSGNEGPLMSLKFKCKSIARDMWNKVKDKIGDTFLYADGSEATEASIANSGSTNVLFNGLFVIGLVFNSAYDVDLHGTEEYDRMVDIMQSCQQKTQRYFDNMSASGQGYKVDSFVLQFTEKFSDPEDARLSSVLRQNNILVSTITPILLKTNSLISEYLIQYPQKQMVKHLERIMENRLKVRGSNVWLWEKEAYHCISNYYYIDALLGFYAYYNKYEKAFVADYEKVLEKVRNDESLHGHIKEELAKTTAGIIALENERAAFEAEKKEADETRKKADAVREKEAKEHKAVSDILNNLADYINSREGNAANVLFSVRNALYAEAKEVLESQGVGYLPDVVMFNKHKENGKAVFETFLDILADIALIDQCNNAKAGGRIEWLENSTTPEKTGKSATFRDKTKTSLLDAIRGIANNNN